MMDRDKVIKGLELCGYMKGMPQCDSCPYDGKQCWKRLKNDALALLKAQEPRDAVVVQNGIDGSGGWWFQCPNCMMEIEPRDRYCKSCGQAVKWDG